MGSRRSSCVLLGASMTAKAESKFWECVRRALGKNWYNRIEHGRGGTPGAPDLELFLDGCILPVELKVGEFNSRTKVVKAHVRAEQILWHNKLWRAGGRSVFLVQVTHPRLCCVAVPGDRALALTTGGIGEGDYSGLTKYDWLWLQVALRCALWPTHQPPSLATQNSALDFCTN